MDSSFTDLFNQLQIIHCMCPKCESIMRLSDLKIRSKDKQTKTWLDTFESDEKSLERKIEKFGEDESEIREKAVKRGRSQVPKILNQSINTNFAKLNYDPYDIKAVLHPHDFVVFEGMNKGQVENVTLLSSKTNNLYLQNLHKEIANAINSKSYDWKVLRVSYDGTIEYK